MAAILSETNLPEERMTPRASFKNSYNCSDSNRVLSSGLFRHQRLLTCPGGASFGE
jgi:hypothetical protein